MNIVIATVVTSFRNASWAMFEYNKIYQVVSGSDTVPKISYTESSKLHKMRCG